MKEIFTKDKIATYLHDFWITMYNANKMQYKSNASFFDIYNAVLIKDRRNYDSNIDEYCKMMNFVIFFSIIREFSILYDNFFPYIREEDLKDLDFDSIFVKSSDSPLFKNKKRDIVTYIRNALNHNDKNNLCSFVFNDDGVYTVEISLHNTNTPFNVELDCSKLLEIIYQLVNRARRYDITIMKRDSDVKIPSYDYNYINQINTFYLLRIHAKTKDGFTPKQRRIIKENHNSHLTGRELINKLGDEIDIYDYHLSWEQVYAVHDKVKLLNHVAKQIDDNTGVLINDDLLKTVIYNTIPLGVLKLDLFEYYTRLLLTLLESNIRLIDAAIITRNESLKHRKYFDSVNNSWTYYTIDNVSNEFFAAGLYFGYMFDSVIADGEIAIGGQKYNRDKIRNSFVHMRNYFSGEKFYLYDLTDSLPEKKAKKIINELNQKFIGSFTINDIAKCVEIYYSNLIKNVSVDNRDASIK